MRECGGVIAMEFIIGWSLFGIGLCIMFYVITCIRKKYAGQQEKYYDPKRIAEQRRLKQAQNKEFGKLVKNNLAHIPRDEPPPLSPDWSAIDRFVRITGFRFCDEGEKYQYSGDRNYYDIHYILKSEYDSDFLRLIELLKEDLDWFINNPTGITLSEENELLENFLRKKYPELSEDSIKQICLLHFYYDR